MNYFSSLLLKTSLILSVSHSYHKEWPNQGPGRAAKTCSFEYDDGDVDADDEGVATMTKTSVNDYDYDDNDDVYTHQQDVNHLIMARDPTYHDDDDYDEDDE